MGDIFVGNTLLNKEEIEQIVDEIINVLAQNKLNYDGANYLLDRSKEKLGEKWFFKG